MEEIQEVSLEPLPSSRYLAPMRMVYSQAGRPSRAWDLMRCLSLLIVITDIIIVTTLLSLLSSLSWTGVTAAWPW